MLHLMLSTTFLFVFLYKIKLIAGIVHTHFINVIKLQIKLECNIICFRIMESYQPTNISII